MPNYTWTEKKALPEHSARPDKHFYVDGERIVAQLVETVDDTWQATTMGGEFIGVFLTVAAAKEAVEEHFKRAD